MGEIWTFCGQDMSCHMEDQNKLRLTNVTFRLFLISLQSLILMPLLSKRLLCRSAELEKSSGLWAYLHKTTHFVKTRLWYQHVVFLILRYLSSLWFYQGLSLETLCWVSQMCLWLVNDRHVHRFRGWGPLREESLRRAFFPRRLGSQTIERQVALLLEYWSSHTSNLWLCSPDDIFTPPCCKKLQNILSIPVWCSSYNCPLIGE